MPPLPSVALVFNPMISWEPRFLGRETLLVLDLTCGIIDSGVSPTLQGHVAQSYCEWRVGDNRVDFPPQEM